MKKVLLFCLLISVGVNAQWVQMSNGMGNNTVYALAVKGDTIFAGTEVAGIYLTTNNGTSWTQTSLNNRWVSSLVVDGINIFAGINYTTAYGVYKSTDYGTTWTQIGLSNISVISLAVNGNNIFAGTYAGLYLSTDYGATWTQTSYPNSFRVRSLLVNGNNIFAGDGGAPGSGVYLSTNNGTNWAQTSLNTGVFFALAANGSNIFAGEYYNGLGVYLSPNNGTNWTQTSLNNRSIQAITVIGNNIFAGTSSNNYCIYVSNDNGGSWMLRNEGLARPVNSFCILNNYIFAGTLLGGVWKRPLGELTGIQTISNEVPNQFSLSQNYPNPFNPSTKIQFALPKSSFAKIIVYDALGRELETLLSEQLNAGTYEADWNAVQFASGVYYYKIITDDLVQTKKMVLIK